MVVHFWRSSVTNGFASGPSRSASATNSLGKLIDARRTAARSRAEEQNRLVERQCRSLNAHLAGRKHYVLYLLLVIVPASGDLDALVSLACNVSAVRLHYHTRAVAQRVVDEVEDVEREDELLRQRKLDGFSGERAVLVADMWSRETYGIRSLESLEHIESFAHSILARRSRNPRPAPSIDRLLLSTAQ